MAEAGPDDGYSIGKFHNDWKVWGWPSANKATNYKGKKTCNRIGCKEKCEYFCAHCNGYYCVDHNSDHNLGGNTCFGISREWVIDLDDIAKGAKKCDRKYTVGKDKALVIVLCPKMAEYSCSHCNSYYCYGHDDSHLKNRTKCKGIEKK
eukprot:405287_1